jgi:hypothetical protein
MNKTNLKNVNPFNPSFILQDLKSKREERSFKVLLNEFSQPSQTFDLSWRFPTASTCPHVRTTATGSHQEAGASSQRLSWTHKQW